MWKVLEYRGREVWKSKEGQFRTQACWISRGQRKEKAFQAEAGREHTVKLCRLWDQEEMGDIILGQSGQILIPAPSPTKFELNILRG